jgi:hypothetical protein
VNVAPVSFAKFVATKAVVAIFVVLSVPAGVGAVGMPVNAGEARGAKLATTNAVVAIFVVLSPGAGVVEVGVPVKAGDESGAKLVTTNPVVASLVVLSPAVGVGAVGDTANVTMPVARSIKSDWLIRTPASSYELIKKLDPVFPPASVSPSLPNFHRSVVAPVLISKPVWVPVSEYIRRRAADASPTRSIPRWPSFTVSAAAIRVPLNVGDANGAKPATTKAVVAILVELSPAVGVGAVGTPVNAGDASGAKLVATKAVVAIFVELSPALTVGAIGVVVNETTPVDRAMVRADPSRTPVSL